MRIIFLSLLLISTLFSSSIHLSQKDANYVAKKVWQNEGAGKDKYLVWWNKGEDFASVGIGHFIWFSKGHSERFREVFPMYVDFMAKKGEKLPSWLHTNTAFPWKTKAEFFKAKKAKYTPVPGVVQLLKTYYAPTSRVYGSSSLKCFASNVKDH